MSGSAGSSPPSVHDDDPSMLSVEATNSDVKSSRKREREVSTEPSLPLPQRSAQDDEPTNRGRESRTKKNKTLLNPDSEEDSPPRSDQPLAAVNSPFGPKVTQIRKRVKDLSWKEGSDPSGSKSASDEDTPDDMRDVQPSPVNLTTDVAHTVTQHEDKDESLPDADEVSPAAPSPPKDTSQPSDLSPDANVATVEPSAPTSAPVTPPAEAEGDSDTVAPLPSASDEAIPRTDKSLKRKSRDSVFFASGDVTEDDPNKKAKDDPIGKTKGEESRPVPSTPPRAKSPNKFNGFASYTSVTSPFLKGATSKSFLDDPAPSNKPAFASFGSSSLFSKFSSPKPPSRTSSPAPKPTFASSGFSAFASKPSPFLAAAASSSGSPGPSTPAFGTPIGRSSSPSVFGASPAPKGSVPKSNEAFGSFSAATTRFGASLATPKGPKSPKSEDEGEEAVDDAEDRGSAAPEASFDDILAGAGGDEEEEKKKVDLEAIDLHTGEEHETTLQQVRAKLYTMDSHDTYKEKGMGMLKVNVRKSDGKGARIVMRADGVLRLLMNASLFHGMSCAIGQDPKFIKISTLEDGVFVHHAIKVGNPKAAQALVDLIHENVPEPAGASSAATPKSGATTPEEAV